VGAREARVALGVAVGGRDVACRDVAPSRPHAFAMRSISRKVEQARHAGLPREALTFHLSEIVALDVASFGGPLHNVRDGRVSLRVWRYNKQHSAGETRPLGCHAAWASLSVPCTLLCSKTAERPFLAKWFNVSLMVREGNRVREAARGEVDLSTFVPDRDAAAAASPQPALLQLAPRGALKAKHGQPVVLQCLVQPSRGAEHISDEDDDTYSRADSSSTLATATASNPLPAEALEQDLRGFDLLVEYAQDLEAQAAAFGGELSPTSPSGGVLSPTSPSGGSVWGPEPNDARPIELSRVTECTEGTEADDDRTLQPTSLAVSASVDDADGSAPEAPFGRRLLAAVNRWAARSR
jgi:hypothetical protein